jgi:Asp-tRNA(Asn)/Glu-tRNA(Gln) amidotransferase A subunit family amidase
VTEPCDLSAVAARRLIGQKALSPVELLQSCMERIEATNGALNAFVALDTARARQAAKAAEARQMRGEPLGLLHGLPVGVKDLDATQGLRTTWGSRIFKDHVPEADEPHVRNIRAAGGIIVGKTNTPEFGAGSNTTNAVYGATGNPFDPDKTCGGSSGGSAVALACGMVPLATGSDYGGSIRTPAGFCGVVGFRPSPGLVPCTTRASGFVPLYVLGPMARTVEDAHLLLKAEASLDKRDPYSNADAARIPDRLSEADISSMRAAFSADLGCAPLDREIRKVFAKKVASFRPVFRAAHDRDPDLGPVLDVAEVLRGLYCATEHRERLEKHRDLLGRNVIDSTERGLKYTLAEVAWAQTEQTKIYHRFNALFDEADVLICPATAVSPFPHAQLFVDEIDGRKLPTYMSWYAIAYALSLAVPAIVVLPCGRDHLGMPFGIQVVGPNGSDARVLGIALALEKVLARDPETARPIPDLAKLAAPSARGQGVRNERTQERNTAAR